MPDSMLAMTTLRRESPDLCHGRSFKYCVATANSGWPSLQRERMQWGCAGVGCDVFFLWLLAVLFKVPGKTPETACCGPLQPHMGEGDLSLFLMPMQLVYVMSVPCDIDKCYIYSTYHIAC